MSTRADALADQFEATNADVLAFVSACDDATWSSPCEGEGWTIGAVAAHIADGYTATTAWMREIVAGRPVSMTMENLHAGNAARSIANARRERNAVLARLRTGGDAVAAYVRSLGDEDLAHSAPFGPSGGRAISAEKLIERVLLVHPRTHLESMRASLAADTAS